MFCGRCENYPGQAKAESKQKSGKVRQQKIRLRVKCLPCKRPKAIPTMHISKYSLTFG